MTVERVSPKVPKPLAVFIFLLFWAIAIVAWSIANLSNIFGVHGFIVDIGLVFAWAGFAALFIETVRGFVGVLVFSLLAVALFAVGDLAGHPGHHVQHPHPRQRGRIRHRPRQRPCRAASHPHLKPTSCRFSRPGHPGGHENMQLMVGRRSTVRSTVVACNHQRPQPGSA